MLFERALSALGIAYKVIRNNPAYKKQTFPGQPNQPVTRPWAYTASCSGRCHEAGGQKGFDVGQNVDATDVGTGVGGLLVARVSIVQEMVRNVLKDTRATE